MPAYLFNIIASLERLYEVFKLTARSSADLHKWSYNRLPITNSSVKQGATISTTKTRQLVRLFYSLNPDLQ